MIPDNVFLLVTAATTIVKLVVDGARIAVPNRPSWVSPILALMLGPLITTLIMVSNGETLTQTTIAQAILAGIFAGCGAIGLTETQKRSN